jgi:hypothetical protein
MVLTYLLFNLWNIVCKWFYCLDTKSFRSGSELNPDSSIHMNCCDSPWLFVIVGLCFAEDTFFITSIFISDLVIIVNVLSILALIATIRQ